MKTKENSFENWMIENIRLSVRKAVNSVFGESNNSVNRDKFARFSRNPLKFIEESGLESRIARLIKGSKLLFNGFQHTIRQKLKVFRQGVRNVFNNCWWCIIGVLAIITAVMYGSRTFWLVEDVDLIDIIANAVEEYLGPLIVVSFGLAAFIRHLVKALRKLGFPHVRAEHIAETICSHVGICPKKETFINL